MAGSSAYTIEDPTEQEKSKYSIESPNPEKEQAANPTVSTPPLAGEMQEKGRVQGITAPGELSGMHETPSEEASNTGLTATGLGLVANPAATAGAVAGGAVGAPLVSSGARRLTSALGASPHTQDVAGTVGGWAGGLGGAMLGGGAANAAEVPEEVSVGGVKFKVPQWFRPEQSGVAPTEPSASEFYENKAQDIMRRGKEQDTLDRTAARNAPEPEPNVVDLSKSPYYNDIKAARAAAAEDAANRNINRPGWTAKLPTRIPNQNAEEAVGETIGERGMTGSEGSAARWTNDKVYQEAARGNRIAIQQIARRGLPMPPNARYVMGDVDLERSIFNPRESTQTETGQPIRNMANPPKTPRRRIILGE